MLGELLNRFVRRIMKVRTAAWVCGTMLLAASPVLLIDLVTDMEQEGCWFIYLSKDLASMKFALKLRSRLRLC